MSQGGLMNKDVVAWAVRQPVKQPSRRFVLWTLAQKADSAGECSPSIKEISDATGLKERMVRYHIEALVRDGYICAQNRGRLTNLFKLLLSGNTLPVKEPLKWQPIAGQTALTGNPLPLKDGLSGNPLPDKSDRDEVSTGNTLPVNETPLSPPSDVSPNNPFLTPPLTPQDTASSDAADLREAERKKTPAPAWLKRLSLPAWQKLTPVHIAELETQANRLGLDIKDESLACDDWMKGQRRTVKAPYTTLKNWLSKAARMREFDGARSRYSRNSTGRVNPPGPGELTIAANQ